jgi:hypothetical protein
MIYCKCEGAFGSYQCGGQRKIKVAAKLNKVSKMKV